MAEEKSFEEQVKEAIEQIRPVLQADGGDCEIAGFDGNKVLLRLKGACAGCPGAQMTLKMGVEHILKESFPELREVVAVE